MPGGVTAPGFTFRREKYGEVYQQVQQIIRFLVKPTFLEVKNGIPILNRGEKIVF